MRLLVTGKQGQVVTALQAVAPPQVEIIAVGRPELDLADPDTLHDVILSAKPDVIASAAAYTAVDKAESEPDLAHAINAAAPEALARIARDLGVPLLHLSTDYVFDGSKDSAYVEDDPTGPLGVYGRTKLDGEDAIRRTTDNHVILRTAWVYSPYGQNFVKTMLRLSETRDTVSVVDDQHGCPTEAGDIARAVIATAQRVHEDESNALRGTFHLSAPEATTWCGFAQGVFDGLARRGGKKVVVNPIATWAYPTPARRPANSRLDAAKMKMAYGIELPSWRQSLPGVLDKLIGNG